MKKVGTSKYLGKGMRKGKMEKNSKICIEKGGDRSVLGPKCKWVLNGRSEYCRSVILIEVDFGEGITWVGEDL